MVNTPAVTTAAKQKTSCNWPTWIGEVAGLGAADLRDSDRVLVAARVLER